jgi:hypothetical protein
MCFMHFLFNFIHQAKQSSSIFTLLSIPFLQSELNSGSGVDDDGPGFEGLYCRVKLLCRAFY